MTIANNVGPKDNKLAVSMEIVKRAGGRKPNPKRKVEEAVDKVSIQLKALVDTITAASITPGEVDRVFRYLQAKLHASHTIARAMCVAPDGAFSLDAEPPASTLVHRGVETVTLPFIIPNEERGVVPVSRPLPPDVVVGPDGKPEGRIAGAGARLKSSTAAAASSEVDGFGFIDSED